MTTGSVVIEDVLFVTGGRFSCPTRVRAVQSFLSPLSKLSDKSIHSASTVSRGNSPHGRSASVGLQLLCDRRATLKRTGRPTTDASVAQSAELLLSWGVRCAHRKAPPEFIEPHVIRSIAVEPMPLMLTGNPYRQRLPDQNHRAIRRAKLPQQIL